jgi:hypothetical protein
MAAISKWCGAVLLGLGVSWVTACSGSSNSSASASGGDQLQNGEVEAFVVNDAVPSTNPDVTGIDEWKVAWVQRVDGTDPFGVVTGYTGHGETRTAAVEFAYGEATQGTVVVRPPDPSQTLSLTVEQLVAMGADLQTIASTLGATDESAPNSLRIQDSSWNPCHDAHVGMAVAGIGGVLSIATLALLCGPGQAIPVAGQLACAGDALLTAGFFGYGVVSEEDREDFCHDHFGF